MPPRTFALILIAVLLAAGLTVAVASLAPASALVWGLPALMALALAVRLGLR